MVSFKSVTTCAAIFWWLQSIDFVLSMLISKKSFSTSLKFGPKGQFLYVKSILAAIFVTMTTVKVE